MAEKQEEKPKTLAEMCKEKEEAGMARTNTWVSMWQESLRYFLSDQLHGKNQYKGWDWVILNYIWPSIMQETAKLSKDFKIVVNPIEESDDEYADAFGGFLNYQWSKVGIRALHRHGMKVQQLYAILCGKLYGFRVCKILWDNEAWYDDKSFPPKWMGEVRYRLWRPSQFWASDSEFINDGDCGTVRWVDLEYAKMKWPDHSNQLVESSRTYKEMLEAGGEHIKGQSGTSANYPNADTGGQDRGIQYSPGGELLDQVFAAERLDRMYGDGANRRYCKISEMYLKDYRTQNKSLKINYQPEELQAMGLGMADQNGGFIDANGKPLTSDNWPVKEEIKWQEPNFPHGRFIIMNEDTILNPDEVDQRYPHSVWPFVVTPHYMLPFMWQGSDAVTLYKHTQDHINITVSHLVNNMKMFGRPRLAIEKDALAAEDHPGRSRKRYKVFSGAGSVIRLARGGLRRFQVLPPTPPSPTIGMLYQLFAQEFKNLTGLHDIAQGKRTGGGTTATEAQFLAISSNDRIKLQNVFEENWVLRCVNLVAELDQYYYDTGRVIRVIGQEKKIGALQITDKSKSFDYDIEIETGQGLPYDEEKKLEKHRMAYELMQNPTPNPMLPEMLRVLDIPSWQKLLVKHEGWMVYMQFAKIVEAQRSGEMDAQQAIQMLIQTAVQMFVKEQKNEQSNSQPA